MNASRLLDSPELSEKQFTQANAIVCQHAKQLAKMMDDLLDVARVTHNKLKLQMSPIDLTLTMQQVVNSIEHRIEEKKQNLEIHCPAGSVTRIADETRLVQALTNLLINSCKYTPEGGNICFSFAIEESDVVFKVVDGGEGMSETLLNKVFEVFIQADQQLDRSMGGMGLGLPIVKMIANAHGGNVTAQSDGPNQGSVLTMRLPLQVPDQFSDDSINPNEQEFHLPDGKKLLIVEDNDGAREMLAGYLELEGFDVRTAENGLVALEVFQEFNPEICVVDIGLPDLNGFEVAKRIRKSQQEPALLIALTGYGQEEDRRQVKAAGFDIHLIKPIDPMSLVDTISQELLGTAETLNQ